MIALGLERIDVAPIADPRDVHEWEEQARVVNSAIVESRDAAIRLLESPDDNVRRLALLSFRYRWPVASDAFDCIVGLAIDDSSIENKLAALSLLFVMSVRTEGTSSRNAVADAIRSVAEGPNQASDVSAAAHSYLTIIDD
jgi:hypothetical protein